MRSVHRGAGVAAGRLNAGQAAAVFSLTEGHLGAGQQTLTAVARLERDRRRALGHLGRHFLRRRELRRGGAAVHLIGQRRQIVVDILAGVLPVAAARYRRRVVHVRNRRDGVAVDHVRLVVVAHHIRRI